MTDFDVFSVAVRRNIQWLAGQQIPQHSLPANALGTVPFREGDLVVLRAAVPSAAPLLATPRSAAAGQALASPATRAGGARRKVVGWISVGRYVARTLADGRGDASSRAAVRATARRFAPQKLVGVHGTLGPSGGLVYRVGTDHDGRPVGHCWDAGGIRDDNPNTEMTPWPAQAMGNYYADAFAAAVFARRSVTQQDPWRARALAALDHAVRTYTQYVGSPIWYHHEFKNAAMIESWGALGQPDSGDWMDRLHGNNYDPANVMAVRMHWVSRRLAVRPQSGDTRRLANARARLLSVQEANGLFRDDRPPHHVGVRDLSYHLFTCAFLARYLDGHDDSEIHAAFLRGVALARTLMVGDGSVALTGRGANNVYQQAAATYAFSWASRFDPSYKQAALKAFGPIGRWQSADGSWPTCLNSHGLHRMAWNHCATPYNALTSYLLQHATDAGTFVPTGPVESVSLGAVMLPPSFARVDAGVELVFASAYPGSVWSGRHGSGVAGTAALVDKGEQIFLALDYLADVDQQVTDLPEVRLDGDVVDWRRPGRIQTLVQGLSYELDCPGGVLRVEIRVRDSRLTVTTSLPPGSAGAVSARLPLLDRVAVKGIPAGAQTRVVPSNPRGTGRLVVWPLTVEDRRAVVSYRLSRGTIVVEPA